MDDQFVYKGIQAIHSVNEFQFYKNKHPRDCQQSAIERYLLLQLSEKSHISKSKPKMHIEKKHE